MTAIRGGLEAARPETRILELQAGDDAAAAVADLQGAGRRAIVELESGRGDVFQVDDIAGLEILQKWPRIVGFADIDAELRGSVASMW